MKAIVTGSNGFIGFNLCRKLQSLTWQVLGIDDLSSGSADNKVPGFRYEHIKVQDKARVEALVREFAPDAIFHLAAIPRVAYSVENPYATAEANVLGTVSVLEGVVRAGRAKTTRVVSTSSSSVYGGADQLPTHEDCPANPQSPYALEKHQGEEWCRLFSRLHGLSAVSLRYFNVFGPYSVFGGAYSTVLSAWLYSLYVNPGTRPFLEGDGQQSRDFCFVDNVVQANILAATSAKNFQGEAFNIAQGQRTSLLEVKVLLEELTGKKLDLEMRPPRVGDVPHTLADISAAQRVLGYKPTTDFKQQVRAMAEWYKTGYPQKK
jgi:UDP-glucose 4-epimerase